MNEKIQEFFDNHLIEPKKENSRSYIFDCPACGGHEKLYIEKSNGRSICFKHANEKCPTTKTGLIKTLALISEIPFEKVKAEIEGQVIATRTEDFEEFDSKNKSKKEDKEEPLLPVTWPHDIQLITWPLAKPGLNYLTNRGLNQTTLHNLKVGYSPGMRRVIFPVLMNDVLYGWQGRAIDKDNSLKMYNIAGQWKAKTLMFYENLKDSNFAILTEGPVDALKFAKVGGFVATMGKLVSNHQIKLILDSGVTKIYLGLDPDAVDEMEEVYHKLLTQANRPIEIFLLKVPDGKKDFGECTEDQCHEAFHTAEKIDLDCLSLYMYAMDRS